MEQKKLETSTQHNLHASICKDNGKLDNLTDKGFKFKIHNGFAIIGVDYQSDIKPKYNHVELKGFLLDLGIEEVLLLNTFGEFSVLNIAIYDNLTNNKFKKSQKFKDIDEGLRFIGVDKKEHDTEFHSISLHQYPTLFNLLQD